ncbi:MAG: thiamine phosphate synthase [Spirochaetia bacterium]|nr:thiamine phosphate synthase [Spirochaetia bacterium]
MEKSGGREIPAGIYAVITEKFCRNGSSVETLEQVLAAGVKLIQLREKDCPESRILVMAKKFRELTQKAGAMLIINDHPDIAALAGADGVHVGQHDMNVKDVKKRYPGLIAGVSTHNLSEALRAQEQGADYINIGPVFATKTKETGEYRPVGCAKLKRILGRVTVPVTVMGGIKSGNIANVAAAGAETFAMITEITMAQDIKGRIAVINRTLGENKLNCKKHI